ncbi:condensation domain-containing protein [Micromonospora sp. DT48]|uniref:condensation domain-containing protein n=1 Tax=unclassified Micromonospora TaxID=2617518 RepID=UPI0012BBD0C2|nr:condensation domain-containing protein [Micromonospora sp. CP22]MTK01497.1 condensation protein [Micromonospora sp. CP22]
MRESPASVGQRLLWLMDHYQGGRRSLTQQVLLRRDTVDVGRLREALTLLGDRHEALRTRLVERRRQLMQQVCPNREPDLDVVDLTGVRDPVDALRDALATDLRQRVPVEQWPTRTTLYRLPDRAVVCLSMHHLITDHSSNGLVLRDLRTIYEALAEATPPDLPEVTWQYATWAQWQRERLAGESRRRLDTFWRDTLDGASLPMLPVRNPEPVDSGSARVRLAEPVVRSLRALARTHRTSMFAVLLAVFYTLLHQRTGQADLTVTSLFANRARSEVANTLGFFVNQVALRSQVDSGEPFTALVRRVRGATIRALPHQDLPFHMLPPGIVQSPSGRADQVVFQMLDPGTTRGDMRGDHLADLEPQTRNTRFDLELLVVPIGDSLVVQLRYTDRLFDDTTARAFVRDFGYLADRFGRQPDDPVGDAVSQLARTEAARPSPTLTEEQ